MARRLNPATALRLEQVEVVAASVRLGSHWALRDVSLQVRAGERWLLFGPNGAGKTVLLKLLRGDVWPTPTGREARRYHLRGGEVLEQPLFAADRIAYLGPERQDRYERYESSLDVAQVVLTGYDEADFPLLAATTAQARRIHAVLERVGLAGLARRRFLTLSYGQRRRVLLARALVREPDLLLLDEALNGLDARGRIAFLRALRRTASPRTAWILSSHRRSDAPADATHLVRIAHGRIVEAQALHAAGETRGAAAPPERTKRARTRTDSGNDVARRSQAALLQLEHAAVYRDGRLVIGAFDWSLERGEHWCVRGANGSGKSTFIALLYGDLWPALGGDLRRRSPAVDDWKARVGLVSPELQARYAATGCTVAEIVASGLHSSIGLNASPTATELRRVQRALRAWDLAELAARRARELSYGQLRRVLLARAFVRSRLLYLLDEPYDGLDVAVRERLRAHLEREVGKGATVVLSTHHDEDVPGYVTRVLQLRRGRAPRVAVRRVEAPRHSARSTP